MHFEQRLGGPQRIGIPGYWPPAHPAGKMPAATISPAHPGLPSSTGCLPSPPADLDLTLNECHCPPAPGSGPRPPAPGPRRPPAPLAPDTRHSTPAARWIVRSGSGSAAVKWCL